MKEALAISGETPPPRKNRSGSLQLHDNSLYWVCRQTSHNGSDGIRAAIESGPPGTRSFLLPKPAVDETPGPMMQTAPSMHEAAQGEPRLVVEPGVAGRVAAI